MPEIQMQALPLLSLTTGVVLPGMVVTIAIESDEARAAVEVTQEGGELLLVPKVDSRYARVGTVAKIEDVGRMRNGTEALVMRGMHRAVVGVGVPGTGEATWIQAEQVEEAPPTERVRDLAREYRATVENIVEARGMPQAAELLRGITDPGQIADMAGYSPDLSFEQKVEVLGDDRRRAAPGAGARVGQGHPRRARGEGQDPQRGRRVDGETAARVHPA